MTSWRFVLSARWARLGVLVLVFAAACAALAWWQWSRREEKVVEITRIEQNYDAAPVPFASALAEPGSYTADDEWRPVRLDGRYLPEDTVLVRNRPHSGQPGYEVLVPFRTDDGRVFTVDRGWVPGTSSGDAPTDVPQPPDGQVTVVVRLKAAEPASFGGTTSSGVLASIQPSEIARLTGVAVDPTSYGLLASEDPAPAARPAPAPRPELDEGPHLSYTVQWIVFGLLAFGGLGFAIRQEYRYRNSDDPEEQRRAAERAARRAARRSDADEEDALLDGADQASETRSA